MQGSQNNILGPCTPWGRPMETKFLHAARVLEAAYRAFKFKRASSNTRQDVEGVQK